MPVNTDLDELIGKPPHWLVRWGSSVFVLVLLTLALIAWLAPYPETRSFNVRLHKDTAIAYIPEKDINSIKAGQRAIVRLNAFALHSTGVVDAVVSQVSNVRNDSGYIAKVVFANGLVTRQGRRMPYREGYTGTVKIIIHRGSFLEKIVRSK